MLHLSGEKRAKKESQVITTSCLLIAKVCLSPHPIERWATYIIAFKMAPELSLLDRRPAYM